MIQVASKYERRVDTRSYEDKKKLFEGVCILVVPFPPRNFFNYVVISLRFSLITLLGRTDFEKLPYLLLLVSFEDFNHKQMFCTELKFVDMGHGPVTQFNFCLSVPYF